MLDKTITSALLQLRAQIIRGRLDGLAHVQALLLARGVDLAGHYVARAYPAKTWAQLCAADHHRRAAQGAYDRTGNL